MWFMKLRGTFFTVAGRTNGGDWPFIYSSSAGMPTSDLALFSWLGAIALGLESVRAPGRRSGAGSAGWPRWHRGGLDPILLGAIQVSAERSRFCRLIVRLASLGGLGQRSSGLLAKLVFWRTRDIDDKQRLRRGAE